ncbi:ER membrane protein complex subunit 4 [Coleophoma cylindrospora]|uniref:ER membrane protein complex subunit 4 n=1 Tax=Coleophoma cylindrospora TaxID=1849047 RepID=A0A3D8R662_9HELO|nr:ER membrane protein complex subunit 4 [Coleophoma cylindrospora]
MSVASIPPPTPPSWVVDLNEPPVSKPKSTAIPDPPGFPAALSGKKQNSSSSKSPATTTRIAPTTEEMDVLKLKKAWEVALAPVKQLPMTAIMMYMSGNSLQIFSIMMVVMAFKNPVMGLVATNQAFEKFESEGTREKLWQVKGVYVLMQLLALALGVWKVNGMGLLPTTRSDWLAWETARDPLEFAIPAF